MSSSVVKGSLQDKMRGCMLGAVLGDCLGSPVECRFWRGIEFPSVQDRFNGYARNAETEPGRRRVYKYTDDTAMARQVALSLISVAGKGPPERPLAVDVADLAGRFVAEYDREKWRGYGSSVGQVFNKIRQIEVGSSPGGDGGDVGDHSEELYFRPAAEQFDGKGSYGNGAAMRAHPVALTSPDLDKVVELADQQSRITHFHPGGINGGVLQAAAVHLALNDAGEESTLSILKDLINARVMAMVPGSGDDANEDSENDNDNCYLKQLAAVSKLLCERDLDSPFDFLDAVSKLGNDISAVRSMPTALFCYLRAMRGHVKGLCHTNAFQRTLELAMSFGGDADTIMSMAGALAGARLGQSGIPDHLIACCEGTSDALQQADMLYKVYHQRP